MNELKRHWVHGVCEECKSVDGKRENLGKMVIIISDSETNHWTEGLSSCEGENKRKILLICLNWSCQYEFD